MLAIHLKGINEKDFFYRTFLLLWSIEYYFLVALLLNLFNLLSKLIELTCLINSILNLHSFNTIFMCVNFACFISREGSYSSRLDDQYGFGLTGSRISTEPRTRGSTCQSCKRKYGIRGQVLCNCGVRKSGS
jgi:hypothetical protein